MDSRSSAGHASGAPGRLSYRGRPESGLGCEARSNGNVRTQEQCRAAGIASGGGAGAVGTRCTHTERCGGAFHAPHPGNGLTGHQSQSKGRECHQIGHGGQTRDLLLLLLRPAAVCWRNAPQLKKHKNRRCFIGDHWRRQGQRQGQRRGNSPGGVARRRTTRQNRRGSPGPTLYPQHQVTRIHCAPSCTLCRSLTAIRSLAGFWGRDLRGRA